jgi:hypothetical protein
MVLIPYVRNELVKLGLSNKVLEVKQEIKALLVRNAGECIVGVFAFEINNELGELVVVSKVFDGVSQGFPSNDGREVAVGLAVNSSQDPSFEVDGPTFIQPEMFPRSVGDQVATPAVSQLVCNDIDILTILRSPFSR